MDAINKLAEKVGGQAAAPAPAPVPAPTAGPAPMPPPQRELRTALSMSDTERKAMELVREGAFLEASAQISQLLDGEGQRFSSWQRARLLARQASRSERRMRACKSITLLGSHSAAEAASGGGCGARRVPQGFVALGNGIASAVAIYGQIDEANGGGAFPGVDESIRRVAVQYTGLRGVVMRSM